MATRAPLFSPALSTDACQTNVAPQTTPPLSLRTSSRKGNGKQQACQQSDREYEAALIAVRYKAETRRMQTDGKHGAEEDSVAWCLLGIVAKGNISEYPSDDDNVTGPEKQASAAKAAQELAPSPMTACRKRSSAELDAAEEDPSSTKKQNVLPHGDPNRVMVYTFCHGKEFYVEVERDSVFHCLAETYSVSGRDTVEGDQGQSLESRNGEINCERCKLFDLRNNNSVNINYHDDSDATEPLCSDAEDNISDGRWGAAKYNDAHYKFPPGVTKQERRASAKAAASIPTTPITAAPIPPVPPVRTPAISLVKAVKAKVAQAAPTPKRLAGSEMLGQYWMSHTGSMTYAQYKLMKNKEKVKEELEKLNGMANGPLFTGRGNGGMSTRSVGQKKKGSPKTANPKSARKTKTSPAEASATVSTPATCKRKSAAIEDSTNPKLKLNMSPKSPQAASPHPGEPRSYAHIQRLEPKVAPQVAEGTSAVDFVPRAIATPTAPSQTLEAEMRNIIADAQAGEGTSWGQRTRARKLNLDKLSGDGVRES
ncbi:hypothetical protein MMC28_002006 [Mycoblastus sanguinarius]|nr:hypothetical protein [Mycoblastus sanguinarius]